MSLLPFAPSLSRTGESRHDYQICLNHLCPFYAALLSIVSTLFPCDSSSSAPDGRDRGMDRGETGTRGRKRWTGKHCEPGRLVKERASMTFRMYSWTRGKPLRGMDEIDLQIHCLRTKVDTSKVQGPKWVLGNKLGTKIAISPFLTRGRGLF
jgi:hypothetical protein